eukprot:TRINITY_DN34279_c0_g1_i1.p1 TRINITY_DN34279_c0_g1~~TRINITY_DN34279_c0_g1_i1.p1  ORF type:complete len:1521 (+),score=292.87 TRINITY_DN34279_c0_g1_i1:93-4655(+)
MARPPLSARGPTSSQGAPKISSGSVPPGAIAATGTVADGHTESDDPVEAGLLGVRLSSSAPFAALAGRASSSVLATRAPASLAPQPTANGQVSGRRPRVVGAAQSASPRPRRVRPVDTVRLAKTELASHEISAAHAVAGKLRLAALPTPAEILDKTTSANATADSVNPGLHEGFYDFATAVVRPQPTARQIATQLREKLEQQLRDLRQKSSGSRCVSDKHVGGVTGETSAQGGEAMLALPAPLAPTTSQKEGLTSGMFHTSPPQVEVSSPSMRTFVGDQQEPEAVDVEATAKLLRAERAKSEASVSFNILETFIKDISVDSRERSSLLDNSRRTFMEATNHLQSLVKTCVRELRQGELERAEQEKSTTALSEENDDLRRIMRQMLSAEAELRSEAGNAEDRAQACERSFEKACEKTKQLEEELASVQDELRSLHDDKNRLRATRDACNSPMMGFSTFVMSTSDHVPQAGQMGGDDKHDGTSIGGAKVGGSKSEKLETKHRSSQLISILGAVESTVEDATQSRRSLHTNKGLLVVGQAQSAEGDGSGGGGSGSQTHRSHAPSLNVMHPTSGTARKIPRASSPREDELSPTRSKSPHTSAGGSDEGEIVTAVRPEELAAASEDLGCIAFPSIIPFLDFSKADTEREHSHTESITQNQEHLHKHLVALQSDYQRELEQNELLQHSVDVALERLLVWVRAIHDSVSRGGLGAAVQQDADALAVCDEVLEWLSKRPCKDWSCETELLEDLFDRHEHVIREHIARDRPRDAEMEELRRSLEEQKKRADDLSEQLLELRSSALGARALSSKRNIHHGSPGRRGSGGVTITAASTAGSGCSNSGPFLANSPRQQQQRQTPQASSGSQSLKMNTTAALHQQKQVQVEHVGVQSGSPLSSRQSLNSSKPEVGVEVGGFILARDGPRQPVDEARSDPQGQLTLHSQNRTDEKRSDRASTGGDEASMTDEAAGNLDQRVRLRSAGGASDIHSGDRLRSADVDRCAGVAHSVLASTDVEARRMRFLSSAFVESIDFTMVPAESRALTLRRRSNGEDVVEAAGTGRSDIGAAAIVSGHGSGSVVGAGATKSSTSHGLREQPRTDEEKLLGSKALHALIADVYLLKKADDQRRDKARQPRRPLNLVLQEMMRRQHGVKRVVHQRAWQLVESLVYHAETDVVSRMFSDFLDGSRDIDELSFYLYCSSVLSIAVADESQALPPTRMPGGFVSLARATRMVELLFADLPKALGVARDELGKSVRYIVQPLMGDYHGMLSDSIGQDAEPGVHVDELHRIVLEGWRMSALLLDQHVPSFSWRRCVLAFVQADVSHRGWLDQHEVMDSASKHLRLTTEMEGLRILERTSLGAFVYYIVNCCNQGSLELNTSSGSTALAVVAGNLRTEAKQDVAQACLQVSQTAFSSLEKTLGIYLTWLMHSEEMRDRAVYQSVKARIYEFRRAADGGHGSDASHHFRSLLLLLLAHQFDMQLHQGALSAELLDWELRCFLRILRESWRRSAGCRDLEQTPEFVAGLEQMGE